MTCECLNTVTASDVPKLEQNDSLVKISEEEKEIVYLSRSIAGSRNKRLLVWREGEGHDVPCVPCEGGHLLPRLDVPQHADKKKRVNFVKLERGSNSPGHVPAGGEDLIVVQKSAAAEISCVPRQLSRYTNCPIAVFQAGNLY